MRKIKLMALLLATLMVVAAFAGCAGVKKEELDALDVRVQALEDLLNGQQKDLEDIKNQLAENGNNSEILDAIESIKTDLEDKIKDVNDRVDDVDGKADATVGVVSDATKTAQQKALAAIEVKRAAFTKNVAKYSEENFEKISEALGTATGAVNAATTTEAVDKALAALDAELVKYLTYQDMAYKYYVDLLGNVNADAADLVEEAKAFLKEVKAVYDEKVAVTGTVDMAAVAYDNTEIDGYVAELLHLVKEGTADIRDEYINIYNAIYTLCELYSGEAKDAEKAVYFENSKGRVDVIMLKSLAGYTKDAADLTEKIAKTFTGDELVYKTAGYNGVAALYNQYEGFAEAAEFLGGEKLVALVTNAADIIEAEETVKLLEEAAEAFDTATKVSAGYKADVFYYYDKLIVNNATGDSAKLLLEADLKEDTTKGLKARPGVWVADEYAKVEEILADWVATYELSDANKKAIIADKKTAAYYEGTATLNTNTSYVSNKLTNDLLVAAYNNFKTDIASKIVEANGIGSANVTMVQLYKEVKELYSDFLTLQKASTAVGTKHPANLTIMLDNLDNVKVIIRDSGIFDKYAEERLEKAFDGVTVPADVKFLDLYTFESDRSALELVRNGVYFKVDMVTDTTVTPATTTKVTVDNRANGSIYKFFVETYPAIEAAADYINGRIEALAEKVTLSDNLAYITLEGEYVAVAGVKNPAGSATPYDETNGKVVVSGDRTFTSSDAVYVPVASTYTNDYYNATTKVTYYENYMDTMKYTVDTTTTPVTVTAGAPITIHAFKYFYPAFEALLDLDVFEADKAARAELLEKLFVDGLAIVAELDAIPYVRTLTNGTANTVYLFNDVDQNGKYESTEDVLYTRTDLGTATAPKYYYVNDLNGDGDYDDANEKYEDTPYLVNLGQKAAVQTLWGKLVAWRELGGNHTMKQFAKYVENGTVYEGVYYMEGFSAADQVKVKTSGEMIEALYLQIEQLLAMVANFKNAVSLVEKANNANAFTATLASDNSYNGTLHRDSGTGGVNHYAWISYSEKQINNQYRANEGIWNGIKAGTSKVMWADNIDTRNDTSLSPSAQVAGFVKKEVALMNVVNLYDQFVDANVQYVGAIDNDYAVAGTTLYYALPEYVAYDEFDKTVDSYAKYDLISVKAYILNKFATGKTTATYTAHELTFVKAIAAAETLADVEALIMSHNAENATAKITFAEIDGLAIYAFKAVKELY